VRSDPGEKPIINFGQDKAIYNQNSSNTYQWVGPNGERPLLPKNNGMGKMVSGFQSRQSGWGIEMTNEQLHQVTSIKEENSILTRKQPQQYWVQQKRDHSPNHHLSKLFNLAVLMVIGQVTIPLYKLKTALIV